VLAAKSDFLFARTAAALFLLLNFFSRRRLL
jgi:hypothetical protein